MRNFETHLNLTNAFNDNKLDCGAVIPIIEDAINIERMNVDANKSISNYSEKFDGEYRIAQAQLLIALLRLHR